MKKLFAAVFLISIFAIVGCASDNTNSSAQAPVDEPLIPADTNNPSTLIGHYKVDYFAIVDGSNGNALLSDNCTYASVNGFANYDCNKATVLADLADIQQHDEGGATITSFLIQMQLDSPEIRNGALKEHAYHHLLFPILTTSISTIPTAIFPTKATERGLTSYFVARPGGDNSDIYKNMYVNTLKNDGEKLSIKLTTKDGKMQYAFHLTKISNTSNGYVQTKGDINIQEGLYAISNVFNTLIKSVFEDIELDALFGKLAKFDNELGATTQP